MALVNEIAVPVPAVIDDVSVTVLDVLDDVSVGELVHDVEVVVKEELELWVVLVSETLEATLLSVTVLIVLDDSVLLVMEPVLRVDVVAVLYVLENVSVAELVRETVVITIADITVIEEVVVVAIPRQMFCCTGLVKLGSGD